MNKPQYLELATESQRRSDDFYECVGEWIRMSSEERRANADRCDEVADAYEKALRDQLEYLKEVPEDDRRNTAIERCIKNLHYLHSQILLTARNPGN